VSLPAVTVSQTPEDKFREYLASRSRPQRYTGQQRELVRYIFARHNHFDADQLIDTVKREHFRASRATVYRTLNKLVDAGMLRRLEVGARTFYEHDYGYPQHEHLFCQQCNRMIEFQHPVIDGIIEEICHRHNFRASSSSLIVRGLCEECLRGRATKRRLDLV
jgi:Fur family transcriptional regulator, ferric uptake regulator